MSDLVVNPEDRFSRVEALMVKTYDHVLHMALETCVNQKVLISQKLAVMYCYND